MANGDPNTMETLLRTVERLWPAAPDVRMVSGRGAGAGGSDDQHLLVVPNARSVRLLVPEQRRAAAAAMRRYSAAISTRELVKRLLVGGALRVTGGRLLPDRVRIAGPAGESLQSHLGDVLGERVSVSVGIGSVRANRKPVLGVFDRQGRAVAYVKVGDSPVATANVRREADALATVGARTWAVLEPPALLHSGSWNGMHVLVISALSSSPWQGRKSEWRIPDAAMAELAGAFDKGPMALAETPMWRRCLGALDLLFDQEMQTKLASALDRVADGVGDRSVQVGAWHGDFTPWNMARRRGRVQLWDWERFETGVPVGLDRMHYAVNVMTRRRGFDAAAITEGLSIGGATMVPLATRDAIAAAYLVSLACRYLLAAQGPGGDAIVDNALAVLSTLTTVAGTSARGGGGVG